MEENKQAAGAGEEQQRVPAWKRKWVASRMAFESILFERELLTEKKEKNYKGIIFFSLIFAFELVLLWLYFLRNGSAMSMEDVQKLKITAAYFSSFTSGGFWDLLKNTGVSSINFDMPLYYVSFLPVLKYVTTDYSWALFLVNSFYLLAFLLAVYLLISRKRNFESALLGTAFAASLPFVIDLARHFSPQLATLAFVSLAYLCFIRSEEFEEPKWIFPMAVSISLGLLNDMLFVVYILPILPWLNYAFAGIYRANIVKGLLPGLILCVPFYLRIVMKATFLYFLNGPEFFKTQGFNLFWYLGPAADAVQLIFFALGAGAMLWMYYSLFMPYDKRKIVTKWFLTPYLVFWLIPFKSPEYIYPALVPFAVAMAIMTPHLIRRYMLGGVLLLSLLNQAGFLPEKSVKIKNRDISVIGLEKLPLKAEKLDEIMTLLKENVSGERQVISVFGESRYINTDTLGLLAGDYGLSGVRFVKYPEEFILFADVVIVKGADNLGRLSPFFHGFFKEKVSFNEKDISVFKREIPGSYLPGPAASFSLKAGSIAGVSFSNAVINARDFDEKRGVYKRADVSVSYAGLGEIDASGIELGFEDLCLINFENSPAVCGFSKVTVNAMMLTDYSLSRFIEKKFKSLKNVEVELDRGLSVSGLLRDKDFETRVEIKTGGGEIFFSVKKLEYRGWSPPKWLYNFMNFRVKESEMTIPVEVKQLRFRKSVLEVYPGGTRNPDNFDEEMDFPGKGSNGVSRGGARNSSRLKAGMKAVLRPNPGLNAPGEDPDEGSK